ncbi:MAG: HD domain-containing protein, partial [Candidatus Lokiarchaeota archaeon]|nr:HD domain-containing protein [Candidatus Lokiarchaeota archaeon]
SGDQSLLAHSKAVSGIATALAEKIDFDSETISLLQAAAFAHDLGKEQEAFQESLKGGSKVTHLPTKEQLHDFLADTPYKDSDDIAKISAIIAKVYAIVVETHRGAGETISQHRALRKVEGGDLPDLVNLGLIVRLADWIASSNSPKDGLKATQHEDFNSLIDEANFHFEYYSLQTARGVLSYILHRGFQQAFEDQDYDPIAFHPEGCLFVGTDPLDKDKLEKAAYRNIRKILENQMFSDEFLQSGVALQINRSMIANDALVALDTLDRLARYGTTVISDLPGKEDDQKRAILLRFISTLQNALRRKIENLELPADRTEKILNQLAEAEEDAFGIDFGEIGLPMSYDFWTDSMKQVSERLEKHGHAPRALTTLPVEEGLESIYKGYKDLVHRIPDLGETNEFAPIESPELDSYLKALLHDINHPTLLNQVASETKNNPSTYHHIAQEFMETYKGAKKNAMGSRDGDIRCPICGTAAPGTKAIAAGVGSGTKKFINGGQGGRRLANVNVCILCILEGILRKNKGYAYVLMPQMSLSPSDAHSLAKLAKNALSKIDRRPAKTVKWLLEKQLLEYSIELEKRLEMISSADRDYFEISSNVVGNFVLMSTYPDSDGSDSDVMARILIQALALHMLLDVRVKIISGLDVISIREKKGAVEFEPTATLLRHLDLRKGVIPLEDASDIFLKLAAAHRAQLYANLSNRNGIMRALEVHPGQLAQRIMLDKKSNILTDSEIQILTILLGDREMTTLADEISNILDEYYRPGGYTKSMHSVLGPMNALYDEFRKNTTPDEEDIQAIAGRVHRQLQQLNEGDYVQFDAAEPILEVCKTLADELSTVGPRERKDRLDDLRYAVYLKRLIAISKRFRKKKGGNSSED